MVTSVEIVSWSFCEGKNVYKKYGEFARMPTAMYSHAQGALQAIWPNRHRVEHFGVYKDAGPNWRVDMLVQVWFQRKHCRGNTFVDVSIFLGESIRTEGGLILIQVVHDNGMRSVLAYKHLEDVSKRPFDVIGRTEVREQDQNDLEKIEVLLSGFSE